MPHHKTELPKPTPEELTLRRIRSLIQRIHDATAVALRDIGNLEPAPPEPILSVRWNCRQCRGDLRHFTRASPIGACAADPCKSCGARDWMPVEYEAPRR